MIVKTTRGASLCVACVITALAITIAIIAAPALENRGTSKSATPSTSAMPTTGTSQAG
jgi:hypothetical protein